MKYVMLLIVAFVVGLATAGSITYMVTHHVQYVDRYVPVYINNEQSMEIPPDPFTVDNKLQLIPNSAVHWEAVKEF